MTSPTSPKSNLHPLLRMLRFLLLLYVGLFLYGWFSANRMAFFPPPPSYQPDDPGIFFVPVADQQRVAVLHIPNPDATLTLLHAHGNAEDIGQLRDYYEVYSEHGVEVFGVDYRGYGHSDGAPSLQRAKDDLRAVYHHLVHQREIPPERILLHGRSLGGAILLPLAAEKPIAGLILESVMINGFRTVIPFPLYPIDPIPNNRHIQRLSAPVHFLHGQNDRIIPLHHGQHLYNRASEPKSADWFPNAGHNDLIHVAWNDYWNSIQSFLDRF